ncbi:MAG: hypothetical protein ACHQWU_09145, partial [Gemmatimonadales bacterium]
MRKLLLASLLLPAAVAARAQQLPPVRLINAPDASSPHAFGSVLAVRQLPDGQLLVNDGGNRQLVLLGATLQPAAIVADSASGSASSYGIRQGSLIPYVADSSLFIDPAGLSMFVLSPAGTIARVASVPRSQDAATLGAQYLNNPGLDAQGRIVYRALPGRGLPVQQAKGQPFQFPDPPDSVALVRVDLATRKLDTAAFYKIAKVKMNVTQTDRGFTATSEINPMPLLDDWAVMSDGTVAVVRGQDFHIDWVNADGSMTASAKVPFEWQRLSDDDKVAVIDSARNEMEKARASAAANPQAAGASGRGASPGDGAAQRVMVFMSGVEATAKGGASPGASAPALTFVSVNELPDYRPAFSNNATRSDLDDNLWIRTTATRPGAIAGPIYDVINRKGELVDRVQIPAGRLIIGFGKGGVVYM